MPEVKLIDRQALLKKIYDNPPERERMTAAEWYRKCIYEAPTIEAEPVPVVTEQAEPERDAVNHPEHYTSGGIECIDCIKAALGSAFIGFLMGNVIKYSYRYKDKNGIEDLKKARWYLDRAIKELAENEKNEYNSV